MTEMTEKEAYLVLQEKSGLEIGDTVKVLRKAKDYEWGWDNDWSPKMNDMIGLEYRIESIGSEGILLISSSGYYRFPFFVLEKVASVDPIIDFIEANDFGCADQKRLTKELVQMILDRIGQNG